MTLRVLMHNWRDAAHPEAGGAERYLVTIAQGLAARGHHVTFRTAAYPGAVAEETVDGVHYVRRGGKYSIYPRAMAAQLMRRHHADVVIDVQNGVPYLSPLVRRGPVVNLVHHVHREQWPVIFSERMAAAGWWVESRLAPAVYRRRDYVAVSHSTTRELTELGVDSGRVRIIHNGTEAVPMDGMERTTHPSMVVLGRLVPQKRVEIAIEALARLVPEHPEMTLTVAGSGWWEPNLRELAEQQGLTDRVHFAGHVSEEEKHVLLAQSWVHALPSLKEGWGLVIVEAGVHGTPTVAFREAGGPSDAILHEETGLLVEPGVDAFTEGLRTLFADDAKRQAMGAAVTGWVAGFTWTCAVDKWEEMLLRAAGRA